MDRIRIAALLAAGLLFLGGCGGRTAPSSTDPGGDVAAERSAPTPAREPTETETEPTAAAPAPSREIPAFREALFHEAAAEELAGCRLDFSALAEGYVAVSARSDKRLKFQVIKDDVTYTYDLASDGTPSIYPLQSGDGAYTFRVMENVVDSKYAELCAETREVKLADEFQPYLRPNDYVRYTESSDCVRLSRELSASVADDAELVAAVYGYICDHISYDTEKAMTVVSGYLPDADSTLREQKGICFDYASLGAAMLRCQGIPTKLITGYVSPEGLYHAWNMFYTEETGWITVTFRVDPGNWNRLDLTFSAGGVGPEFVGDGSNYTDLYQY